MHAQPDPQEKQETAQILKFELRRARQPAPLLHAIVDNHDNSPDDLAQYEEEDIHIDYRHRMLMNVIAVAIVTVLVGTGVWIADTIADMEKVQDCAMQGRQNCAPIEVPPPGR